MTDTFRSHATGLDSPARGAASVTPNDGTALSTFSRALYVGTAGNVAVTTVDGDTVTFTAASGFLPVCVSHVLSTGTTATDILALW